MSGPLAYRTEGPADAPALVLLHAIATSSAMWAPQIAVWSRAFRVIAFDLPGHGGSELASGAPGIAAMADAVAHSCSALGVDQAAFVGLSLGSMVAQRLAADRPDLVRAAILSNGVCTVPPAGAQAWRDRTLAARSGGMEPQVGPTITRWFTDTFRADAPMTVDAIAALVRATSVDGYAFAAEAIAALDQRELVGKISCPALILAGDYDLAAPPAAVKALADAITGARFAVLPAPHLANVEVPTLYTETVGAFLMEHGR